MIVMWPNVRERAAFSAAFSRDVPARAEAPLEPKPRPGAIERRVNAARKFIDTSLLAAAAVLALLVALFAPPRDAKAAPATSRQEIAEGLSVNVDAA